MIHAIDTTTTNITDIYQFIELVFVDYPELIEILNIRLSYEDNTGIERLFEDFLRINNDILKGNTTEEQQKQILHDFYIASKGFLNGVNVIQRQLAFEAKETLERSVDRQSALSTIDMF